MKFQKNYVVDSLELVILNLHIKIISNSLKSKKDFPEKCLEFRSPSWQNQLKLILKILLRVLKNILEFQERVQNHHQPSCCYCYPQKKILQILT